MTQTSKHTAIARCSKCGDTIISSAGGIFTACRCGKSYIDQERFGGLYVRLGGSAVFVEQICPETCEYRSKGAGNHSNHSGNRLYHDTVLLDKYMLEVYDAKWCNGQFIIPRRDN